MVQVDLRRELESLPTKKFAMPNVVLEGGMDNSQMVQLSIRKRKRLVSVNTE